MSVGDLQLSTRPLPSGGTVVGVTGELDLSTVSRLEEEIAAALSAGRVLVDLSECTFLDSSALRVLAVAHRSAAEADVQFALVAPAPGIRRVLEIASMDRAIAVHDSIADAG